MTAHDPLVVIPTYNEVENIGPMIAAVLSNLPNASMLVVDDGSPDGTADRVEEVANEHPEGRVTVLRRPGKAGLGTAYRDGFELGMQRGHQVLVQMDADFQHDPASLPSLIEALEAGADMVIGSRYAPGGSVPDEWPSYRKALSKYANFYARTMLGVATRDVTGGFRAHRAELLRKLDLPTIRADGYAFQIGLTDRAHQANATVVEVPIQFGERHVGDSKMSMAIVVEAFKFVTRTALRHRLLRRRRGE